MRKMLIVLLSVALLFAPWGEMHAASHPHAGNVPAVHRAEVHPPEHAPGDSPFVRLFWLVAATVVTIAVYKIKESVFDSVDLDEPNLWPGAWGNRGAEVFVEIPPRGRTYRLLHQSINVYDLRADTLDRTRGEVTCTVFCGGGSHEVGHAVLRRRAGEDRNLPAIEIRFTEADFGETEEQTTPETSNPAAKDSEPAEVIVNADLERSR